MTVIKGIGKSRVGVSLEDDELGYLLFSSSVIWGLILSKQHSWNKK